MNAERFVIDTSAILTLIEDEAGADRVQDIIRHYDASMPWVVVLEATYITRQEQGSEEADLRYALLNELPATIWWQADEPVLLTAARLKASHQLSLADAIIAAYAVREDATLLHKDPDYEALSGEVRLEALPYKAARNIP